MRDGATAVASAVTRGRATMAARKPALLRSEGGESFVFISSPPSSSSLRSCSGKEDSVDGSEEDGIVARRTV
ncbi:hypothetical protein NL676_023276 [Syzygium grande]|nr:hypothetical protein NL676_023276 [Syzygium grande]